MALEQLSTFEDLDQAARAALGRHALSYFPLETRPNILDWAEEHVRYPHSDRSPRFSREFAYWLNSPLEAATGGQWRVVSVMAPAGSGKTCLVETLAAYIVAVDPGAMLIVGQTDADIASFAETRLSPMLKAIPACQRLFPKNRHHVRKSEVLFPHMPVFLGGANLTTLQSKSCRWVVLDECWLMKRSMVREAFGRTHDRPNSVVLALGQAGLVGDEHDLLHKTTLENIYGWTCPECASWHQYSFRGDLRYDDTRDERGVWQWQALAQSVRMVCPSCETSFSDTEENRRLLSRGGSYRPIPCNALPERIGYSYSALAVWWISWATVTIEFIKANARKRGGDYEPLRQWIQKRLAEPWSQDDEAPEVIFQASGYTQAEFEDGRKIENESYRLLTVDIQRDHFWAVVRAWRADGSSQLLYVGRLLEWSQITVTRERYRVSPLLTLIDCGFDTGRVYAFCAAHGYVAMKGDARDEFIHRHSGKISKRFYSPVERVNLGGKTAMLIRWSNTRIKDILGRLRTKDSPVPFEIPCDVSSDYQEQMTSEIKKDVVNKNTGDVTQRWVRIGDRANHIWDAENLQVVGALMLKVLRLGETEEENAKVV